MEKKIKIQRAKEKEAVKICALGRKTKELTASEKAKFHRKKDMAKIMSSQWSVIDSVVLDQSYRGQGIGTLILDKLFNILEKKRIYYAQAFVGTENIKGRKFWQEQRFKQGKKFIWVEKNL